MNFNNSRNQISLNTCHIMFTSQAFKKNTFSLVATYKLVLPEPANSQNEESKSCMVSVAHLLKTVLQQAVKIELLSLRN